MNAQNVDVDYCGIVNLLRQLTQSGICTKQEAKNVAAKIASRFDVSIILSL